jgi:hypothetical protein
MTVMRGIEERGGSGWLMETDEDRNERRRKSSYRE